MKHLIRRVLAASLALALTVTPALASQALGWELERGVTTVGPGATVTTQTFWGDSRSDYRAEQFFTYTPGQGVSPVVAYGPTVPSKATLTAMAKTLESGGNRVLAGANGDYFVVATGVPLGIVVTDGVLRSSASYHYAVGFDQDGKAIVGQPEMTVWVDITGMHLAARGGYNKTRVQEDGLTVFNRDFGAATSGSGEGINVILRPVTVPADYAPPTYQPPEYQPPVLPGVTDPETYAAALAAYEEEYNAALAAYEAEYNAALAASAANLSTAPARLTIGGEKVTCVVTGLSTQTGGVAIPESGFILTAGTGSNEFYQTTLSNLRVGEQVSLSVTCPDERWNTVRQAMGGYQLLLKDGVVQDGLDNTANPRTALGVKENGQVILYTIDGRKSGHSVGASMKQVAARLKELGCVDGVLFDGGGSTTFGMTGAMDQSFTLQNTPSDGGQRAVSDALFFVSALQPTGALGSLYITPKSGLFLPGGKADLTAQGVDTGYYPMTGGVGEVTYSVSGPGSVSGRTFTAGATTEKTEAIVTGTAVDGQQGSTVLTVVPTPHTITVTNEATGQAVTSLNLDPDQSIALSAAATWYGLPLTATDDCFTWAVTGGAGTVSGVGTFTAGSKAASGAITVTAGEKTVSVPVAVAGHITPLEDFEGDENPFRSDAAPWLTDEQVKYGRQAMAVVCGEPAVRLETDLPLPAGETDLSFWLYPEGTVNLEVLFRLTDGTQTAVPIGASERDRWNFVQVPLPENAEAVSGLRITAVAGMTVYVDQFSSTNGGLRDETPPTVQMQYANGAVTAQLSDNVDRTFDPARLELTLDGAPIPFTLSGSTVTAGVNVQDGLLHRVSLTVEDASGNLARASAQIDPAAGAASPFVDTQDHWAAPYADYLYAQGVTQGSPSAAGLQFQPGTNITRGDFVTMLCRWMDLDLSQYSHVALPFDDASSIQSWAVDAVKAAYDLGIFNGSAAAGDRIYALTNQPITRAEAMTLLGRVQPRGYARSGQVFLDQGDVPAWAEEYVSILVAQGVVSGYGGYVRPQDPITRAEVAKVLSVMW